jgi:uncharacterized membrane protein
MKSRRIVEALSLAAVAACFAWAAHAYATLPDTVSTHFNAAGAADAHGSKGVVWIAALFTAFMFLFLSAMQFVPPRYSNYPVAVTEANREHLYSLQRELLSVLKFTTMLTGLALEWGIVASARRAALDPFFLPAIIATILAAVAVSFYYILKMRAA